MLGNRWKDCPMVLVLSSMNSSSWVITTHEWNICARQIGLFPLFFRVKKTLKPPPSIYPGMDEEFQNLQLQSAQSMDIWTNSFQTNFKSGVDKCFSPRIILAQLGIQNIQLHSACSFCLIDVVGRTIAPVTVGRFLKFIQMRPNHPTSLKNKRRSNRITQPFGTVK